MSKGGATDDGTPVQLRDCDGSNGQPDMVQVFLDNEAAMRNVEGL